MDTTVRDVASSDLITAVSARSVGKKILMAASGLVAFGYVVGHMLGNLQIFLGREQLNTYAETLHEMGPLLWLVRLFLLIFLAIHIWKGIQLTIENWSSRPIGYRRRATVQATLASRTMIYTGAIVLFFVIYHILHFTVRSTHPEYKDLLDPVGRPDVYSMVILGFGNYLISGFYIVAVGLACFHLSHGIASMFQSVGWSTPRFLARVEKLGVAASITLFLGYIAVPVAVMLGWLCLPEGVG